MRTPLNLDDNVLEAARAIAARTGHSLGTVVSDLARETLEAETPKIECRNGVLLLPTRKGVVVTTAHINALREELDGGLVSIDIHEDRCLGSSFRG